MAESSNLNEEKIMEIPLPNVVETKKLTKIDILKKLSSGTMLREGLNDIVSSSRGAIIVIANPKASNVFVGGFRIDCKFTPKRLAELAKMDGAIVLSEDFKKILYASTLLVPDSNLGSNETGIRHQSAERTAKQIEGIVIAVSERKHEITIYYGNSRYVLQHTEDLLRRATETLQILEKQRDIFNELYINLNVLEVTNLVSVSDVCTILKRLEMIKKMAGIINEHITELGKDGLVVRMRMKEIMGGLETVQDFIIRDYLKKIIKAKNFLNNLSFDGILDTDNNIAEVLFGESLNNKIVPKGYRLLNKTSLKKIEIENLIKNFKNLDWILNAREGALQSVLGYNTEKFKQEINTLREQIMVGKRI